MSTTISISDYQVMKSAAGFYIGRSSIEKTDDGLVFPCPYDRASGYYATEDTLQLQNYKNTSFERANNF